MPQSPRPIEITKPPWRRTPTALWRRAGLAAKLLASLAALVLVGIALVPAVLLAPPFADLRRTLAESLLERELGGDVRLNGPLDLALGPETRVMFSELTIKNPSWASKPNLLRVQSGEVTVRLWPLLAGLVIVPRLVIDGAVLSLETGPEGRGNWQASGFDHQAQNTQTAEPASIPLLESISIKDVTIEKLDRANGWDWELLLDTVQSKRGPDGRGSTLAGRGLLNGTPLTIAGRLPDPDLAVASANPYPFQLSLDASGFEIRLEGTMADPANAKGLDLTFTNRVPSLGDLLEAVDIDRALEGRGELKARLTGDLESLAVDRFEYEATLEAGDKVRVTGSIADLWRGAGLDVEIDGKIDWGTTAEGDAGLFQNLRLTGFSGRIAGDLEQIVLEHLHIETDALQRDLREIGPMSVEAFRKDEQGRLQLVGIKVRAGPRDRPVLDVEGSVGDLLRLKRVSFAGRFDLDTASIFALETEKVRAALGRLEGELRVSDADGSLGFEKLKAAVTGTDMLSLTFEAVLDDIPKGDAIELDLSLRVPKYQALARLLGQTAYDVGTIRFDGRVAGNDEQIRVNGKALVGRTNLSGDLSGTLKGRRPSLSGKLSSPLLHWADLRALPVFGANAGGATAGARKAEQASARNARGTAVKKRRSDKKGAPAKAAPRNSAAGKKPRQPNSAGLDLLGQLDLDLELGIDKIAGGGTDVSSMAGRFKLEDGLLSVDPLRVVYLGGRVRMNGSLDSRARPARLRAKGSVGGLPVGSLLKEANADVPVTGALYLNFDVSATGSTQRALVRSLKGRVGAALSRGRIRSTLFNLAGLDLTRWLVSKSTRPGYSDLNCLIARFDVKSGVATSRALILDTSDVLFQGSGTVDLPRDAINIRVVPRPKIRTIVNQVVPFTITGSLTRPQVKISGAHAVAATVGDVLLWDVNLLGTLLGLIASPAQDPGNPCLGKGRRKAAPAGSRPPSRAPQPSRR